MRYLIQNTYGRMALLGLLFLPAVQQLHAQAVTPTNNKPDGSTVNTDTIPYPGIRNLNGNGKFNYVRTIIPDHSQLEINKMFSFMTWKT